MSFGCSARIHKIEIYIFFTLSSNLNSFLYSQMLKSIYINEAWNFRLWKVLKMTKLDYLNMISEGLKLTLRILIIVYTRLLILGNFQAKNTIIFWYFLFQSEKLASNVCSLWGKYHFLHSRRVLGSYLCLKYYPFGSFLPPYTIIRAYTIIRVLRV